MDFFASQDHARKQTRLMLVLFALAVACIVLSINLVGGAVYLYVTNTRASSIGQALYSVPHKAYWMTSLVVLGVIAYGTLNRMSALSGGGQAVAEMMGARRIKSDGSDLAEQKFVNIVEEMAIAAGIAMPSVYVMDDQRGINAFAAGYSPDKAAVTVTRGALDRLNRDELQGVIAHEFSHILNGDMRLNIRLMGVVAGIVAIGGIGRFLMNISRGGADGRSRRKGDLRLLALGFAIWLIGSIGVLFGTLIKAAISRQREFLADASAVQFTRNPEGIASALYQITRNGSGVYQRHADELSHMYFSAGMNDFFATHPPLGQRIERIMGPGAIPLLKHHARQPPAETAAGRENRIADALTSPISTQIGADGAVEFADSPRSPAVQSGFSNAGTDMLQTTPATMMSSVGKLSATHVDHARRMIDMLPKEVRRALDTEAGAQAALFALVLGEAELRKRQLALITTHTNELMSTAAQRLADALKPLGIRARLPVFELAMPSLRSLDQPGRDETLALMEALINADGKVNVGEFVLLTLCRSHLKKPAGGMAPVRHRSLQALQKEAATILSLLLSHGQARTDIYARVAASLELHPVSPDPVSAITLRTVETALDELKLLAPLQKSAFIRACLEIVISDGKITIAEGELMRAICSATEVPLPPILEESPLLQ